MTTFEDLPNELLLNIFEYLSTPADIHRSFNRLNDRLDHLLQSLRLSIDVFCEDEECLSLMNYFTWNFNRLRLFHTCPSIGLDRLHGVRSLRITEPTDAQMQSLHSHTLPLLEYLASPASMVCFHSLGNHCHCPSSSSLAHLRLSLRHFDSTMVVSSFVSLLLLPFPRSEIHLADEYSAPQSLWRDLFSQDSQ